MIGIAIRDFYIEVGLCILHSCRRFCAPHSDSDEHGTSIADETVANLHSTTSRIDQTSSRIARCYRQLQVFPQSSIQRDNMNTTSLLLNGRPASLFSIVSSPARSSSAVASTPSTTPTSTPSSSPRVRPRQLRRVSTDSTGWYLDHDTPSLKDFEVRAQTFAKRIEKFASRCATNVVMGLMSPAAVVLFVFNPIMMVLVVLMLIAMLSGRG